jgi:hypothetical protein
MKPAEFAKRRSKIEYAQRKSRTWKHRAMQKLIREASAVVVMSAGRVIGWQMQNGQIVCFKQRYRNEDQAALNLAMIRASSCRDVLPQRAYYCPTCNGWHLSSRA